MSTEKDTPVASTAETVATAEKRASAATVRRKAAGSSPESKQPVSDPVRLFSSWCKGCGICVAFCPTKTLEISPITGKCIIVLAEACTKCGLCELRCPDFAVTVVLNEGPEPGDKNV